MTNITIYKVFFGIFAFFALSLVIIANANLYSHQKNQKEIIQVKPDIHSIPKKQIKKNKKPVRVKTFRYFAYILNDKEEQLKEKLIKRYRLDVHKAEQYAKVIAKVSRSYNIPSDLLAALIRTESNYLDQAVSHKNAIGPAQIIAKYWKKECADDLFDIDNNIQCAGIILSQYNKVCRKDWDCTLQMYNVGPRNYYKKNNYYKSAGKRYLAKINRNLKRLNS